jgi:ankyrin repeat protein
VAKHSTGKTLGRLLAVAALAAATPIAAQNYSEGYIFLKAVKERDGAKVSGIVSQPGSIAVNTRDRSTGEGALHYVVRDRDLTWLSFLLGKGARPDIQNQQGNTPLILAAQLGWLEGAELLLGRNASIDLPNARGETPLIFAVQRGNLAMVRLLMTEGANPKRTDSVAGYSALDYATRDGRNPAIVKVLETPRAPARKASGPKL